MCWMQALSSMNGRASYKVILSSGGILQLALTQRNLLWRFNLPKQILGWHKQLQEEKENQKGKKHLSTTHSPEHISLQGMLDPNHIAHSIFYFCFSFGQSHTPMFLIALLLLFIYFFKLEFPGLQKSCRTSKNIYTWCCTCFIYFSVDWVHGLGHMIFIE